MVEIDKQHRRLRAFLLRLHQCVVQQSHQVAAVGQLRQVVVQSQKDFMLLRLLALGDVAQHHDAVAGIVLGHGLAHYFDRDFVPVPVHDGCFKEVFAAVARIFVHWPLKALGQQLIARVAA